MSLAIMILRRLVYSESVRALRSSLLRVLQAIRYLNRALKSSSKDFKDFIIELVMNSEDFIIELVYNMNLNYTFSYDSSM
jgi:hypothetical protein